MRSVERLGISGYRPLNKITRKDATPLPLISDNLSRLAHCKVFSAIDGAGAFHAVDIRPEDRQKTAFSTPWGLFEFKRLPFGLTNGEDDGLRVRT